MVKEIGDSTNRALSKLWAYWMMKKEWMEKRKSRARKIFVGAFLGAVIVAAAVALTGCNTDGTFDWNTAIGLAQTVDEFRSDREAANELRDEFNRQAKRERATFMLAAIRAYMVWAETESVEEALLAADIISIAGAGMTFAALADRIWTESDRRPDNPPVFVSEIMEILEDHLRDREENFNADKLIR